MSQKDKRLKMDDGEKALFGIDKLNIPRSTVPAITHVRILSSHSNGT